MVLHRSWEPCKSLQIYRTPLGILAYLSNAAVWMVSTRPLISKSFNPLVTVRRLPTLIGITITFMFHIFSILCQGWCIIIIIYSFRVFHISVSWRYFTGVWVTAILLKSPGFFSVFWSFSIRLSFGWCPLVRQLPSHPFPLIIL